MQRIKMWIAALAVLVFITGCGKAEDKLSDRVRIDHGNGLYQINEYDDNDRLVRYETYSDDKLTYYTLISYDENNRVTGTQTYTAADALDMTTQTEYDENGTAYTTTYDGSSNITHQTVHEYYDNGNIRRYEVYTTGEGKYLVIEYNQEGEETSSKWYTYETGEAK